MLSTGSAFAAATWARAMVRGPLPYSLEKRARIAVPPAETCTSWRRVLCDRPGAGGRLSGSVSCWAAAQVPIQWRSPLPLGNDDVAPPPVAGVKAADAVLQPARAKDADRIVIADRLSIAGYCSQPKAG